MCQTFKPWTLNLQTFNPDTKRANANAGRREKTSQQTWQKYNQSLFCSCSCASCCFCCCCCRRGLQSLLHVRTVSKIEINRGMPASIACYAQITSLKYKVPNADVYESLRANSLCRPWYSCGVKQKKCRTCHALPRKSIWRLIQLKAVHPTQPAPRNAAPATRKLFHQ